MIQRLQPNDWILREFGDTPQEEIRSMYNGCTEAGILAQMDTMWFDDDNAELARQVYKWLNPRGEN
jgi:hypothetical protein